MVFNHSRVTEEGLLVYFLLENLIGYAEIPSMERLDFFIHTV
jgi:hypothetical protein